MPTITPTVARHGSNGLAVVTWAGITQGDTIIPLDNRAHMIPAVLATVQVSGSFSGATVTFAGSVNGATYVTLKDADNTDISLTAAGIRELSTSCVYLAPTIATGSGASVNVALSVYLPREFR